MQCCLLLALTGEVDVTLSVEMVHREMGHEAVIIMRQQRDRNVKVLVLRSLRQLVAQAAEKVSLFILMTKYFRSWNI